LGDIEKFAKVFLVAVVVSQYCTFSLLNQKCVRVIIDLLAYKSLFVNVKGIYFLMPYCFFKMSYHLALAYVNLLLLYCGPVASKFLIKTVPGVCGISYLSKQFGHLCHYAGLIDIALINPKSSTLP